MRVDDRAELVRRWQIGNQRLGDERRHCQHHGVVGRKLHHLLAEIERRDPSPRESERMQIVLERDRGALLLQEGDRRLDQRCRQSVAGDQRPAGTPPERQRLADHRRGEARIGLRRIGVERRQQHRLQQPIIERSRATS